MTSLLKNIRLVGKEDDDKKRSKKLAQLRSYYVVSDSDLDFNSVNWADLKLTDTVLGKGSFGTVILGTLYGKPVAVKQLRKIDVLKAKQADHISREIEFFERVRHPFMVKYCGRYKNDRHLHIIMRFYNGGEFFNMLCDKDRLNEDETRFYVSQVIMFLDHIHEENYAYRDLKPENIMLDEHGYISITDMGFCTYIKPGQKTYTTCGTPEYMAPEVAGQQGHDGGYDWWALGILIFEMLYTVTPFAGNNALEVKQSIKNGFKFPSDPEVSSDCKKLVNSLLSVDITRRAGCMVGGVKDILYCSWFTNAKFDHNEIIKRNVKAPWLPNVKSEFDTTHFPAGSLSPPPLPCVGSDDPFDDWPAVA